MRFFGILVGAVSLVAVASAAELKVKVVDPRSAAVSGAQVILLNQSKSVPLAVENTSVEGTIVFHADGGPFQVKVLAAGFAPKTVDASGTELTVELAVGPVSETVLVSATRALVPAEASGADVTSLSGSQLESMNPIAANDALRFLPGAVIGTTGHRGGLSSLFVRGGESRYNKVIVDGVPIDEPGGTFDFGVVPLQQADRLEFVRGAQSTLYGSDAMTSVVQVFTRNGSTERPELSFGADGGNQGTAHGDLSLSGAHGRFDYNLFGDQYNTSGQGINDDYSNSSQGGNIGVALNSWATLRLRARHSNSYSGVQGEWQFYGAPDLPPDDNQFARQNNLLGSLELDINRPSGWQHRFVGYDYSHRRDNENGTNIDRADAFDFAFHSISNINRSGIRLRRQLYRA